MLFPYWRTGSAGAVACVAAAIFAVPIVASDTTKNAIALAASQILNDPFPYYFPEENATSAAQLFAMPLCNGVKLEEATIDELQSHMSKGKLTSVQIVTCYMQRAYQTGEYIK
jgi:amidase